MPLFSRCANTFFGSYQSKSLCCCRAQRKLPTWCQLRVRPHQCRSRNRCSLRRTRHWPRENRRWGSDVKAWSLGSRQRRKHQTRRKACRLAEERRLHISSWPSKLQMENSRMDFRLSEGSRRVLETTAAGDSKPSSRTFQNEDKNSLFSGDNNYFYLNNFSLRSTDWLNGYCKLNK